MREIMLPEGRTQDHLSRLDIKRAVQAFRGNPDPQKSRPSDAVKFSGQLPLMSWLKRRIGNLLSQ